MLVNFNHMYVCLKLNFIFEKFGQNGSAISENKVRENNTFLYEQNSGDLLYAKLKWTFTMK